MAGYAPSKGDGLPSIDDSGDETSDGVIDWIFDIPGNLLDGFQDVFGSIDNAWKNLIHMNNDVYGASNTDKKNSDDVTTSTVKNPPKTFADFSTLTYKKENCMLYKGAVENGMTEMNDWNAACEQYGIKIVSKDAVDNQLGSEKKGTDDGLDAKETKITATSTATTVPTSTPVPPPVQSSSLTYDPDGKGVLGLKSPDGVDWSNPEVWYHTPGNSFEAFGLKVSGDDIYYLIVARNDVDLDKNVLSVALKSGYGGDERKVNIGIKKSSLLFSKEQINEAESKPLGNNLYQIKLPGHYKTIKERIHKKLTFITLMTENLEESKKLPKAESITKELGLNSQ